MMRNKRQKASRKSFLRDAEDVIPYRVSLNSALCTLHFALCTFPLPYLFSNAYRQTQSLYVISENADRLFGYNHSFSWTVKQFS